MSDQAHIVNALAAALEKDGTPVQRFETHISWVLVAGKYAYKLKKAVHFDFVDFSTLDARHFFCREELRLNRRLAPDIYLDVVAITGSPDRPAIDGAGSVIEYAVRMHAFEQQALWSYRIPHRLLSSHEIDDFAAKIARFHQSAAPAPDNSAWGMPVVLQATADNNLDQIRDLVDGDDGKRRLAGLQAWDGAQRRTLNDAFLRRKALGFVRECHGDLHGGNILTIDGRAEAFDCIEFNDALRWIDVMNDIAFTCMDLRFQGRGDLAARFLNRYLEQTGDHEGLPVLRYYEIQRALVRCKVALLRERQLAGDARGGRQGYAYLEYALSRIKPKPAALMITHGYSGSGKSTFAERVVELVGAVQLRSDVERKRMHGLAATARMAAAPGGGLYDRDTTRLTYERLLERARQVIEAGWPAIVDAAFLKAEQRLAFAELASESGVPFFIFDIRADVATMRSRIASRQKRGRDASDAGLEVLARQLASDDPLTDEEGRHVIPVDTENGLDQAAVRRLLQERHLEYGD